MTDTNTPTTLPSPEHRRESDGLAVWSRVGAWIQRPAPEWRAEHAASVRIGLAFIHPIGTRYNPTPHDAVDWSSDERPPVWVRLPTKDCNDRVVALGENQAHFLLSGSFVWAWESVRGHPSDVARYAIETVCGEHVGRLVWWRGDEPKTPPKTPPEGMARAYRHKPTGKLYRWAGDVYLCGGVQLEHVEVQMYPELFDAVDDEPTETVYDYESTVDFDEPVKVPPVWSGDDGECPKCEDDPTVTPGTCECPVHRDPGDEPDGPCVTCGYIVCNCDGRPLESILAPQPEPEHDPATCPVCKTIDRDALGVL